MIIPVVFCFDSRIVLGASVAIKSLIDCAQDTTTYDIRIFHSDLSLTIQKNLSELVKNTRHNIVFHCIDKDIFQGAPHNNASWTEIVYYRLLIPEILPQYDKVIYSDVDVLFKDDLSEVYNIDLTEYEIAAVPMEINDKNRLICHKYFPENKNDKIYISSFLIFNSKLMREENTIQKFFNTIEKINNRLKFYDLDTMNIALDKIYPLSFRYGVLQSIMYSEQLENAEEYVFLKGIYDDKDLIEAKNNPVVVHFAGKLGKPWRSNKIYSDYKRYIDILPKELKKYTLRDYKKKIFNKIFN